MNGPLSREEIDAKLETGRMSSEAFFARMDARCTRMEASFEARCLRMEGEFTARMSALEAAMIARMDAMEECLNARMAAMHRAMIITAITSTLTIILGAGAINATVFTGMLSAMGQGKELGAMMTSLQRQQLDHETRFEHMMQKHKEDFARLDAKLDARIKLDSEERERAHQQRMRALDAGK